MAKNFITTITLHARLHGAFNFIGINPFVPVGIFAGGPHGSGGNMGSSLSYMGVPHASSTFQQKGSTASPVPTGVVDATIRGGTETHVVHISANPDALPDLSEHYVGPPSWVPIGMGSNGVTANAGYDAGIQHISAIVGAKIKPVYQTLTLPQLRYSGPMGSSGAVLTDELVQPAETTETFKQGLASRFNDALAHAFATLGHVQFTPAEKQREVFMVDEKKYPSSKGHQMVYNDSVTVKVSGSRYVDFTFPVAVYYDTEKGALFYDATVKEEFQGVEADAYRGRMAYEEELRDAIARKSAGLQYITPGARPVATLHPDLSTNSRQFYDQWWENVSQVNDALQKRVAQPDDAYNRYTESGGTLDRDAWADLVDRKTTADDPSDKVDKPGGAFDSIGSGLGWAANKVGDGLSWLGNSTLDLLKSWGPMGTAGAYAGVKATNAVEKSDNRLWLYGGAALLAVLLLR